MTREWRERRSLLVLGLFVLLALLHTWPLVLHPASSSRHDNADAILNEWTIAWVAHQLPRAPLRLFDANIFHPDRGTLAYSEHLFVPALFAAPLLWAGAPTLLAYNFVLLSGLILTGWTTALVVRRWTDDWWAGILAGSLVTFNAHTMTRLPQLQAFHVEFFPLTLLALDAWLNAVRGGERRRANVAALWVAVWFALLALCSNYLLVLTFMAIAVAVTSRADDWLARLKPLLTGAAVIAVVSGLAIAPFLRPYAAVREAVGLDRSLDEVSRYSAHWTDYLTTGGRLHFALWSSRFYRATDALFPTFIGLTLAAVAIVRAGVLGDRRVRMLVAISAIGFCLSFGPAFAPYVWLYAAFPLLRGIRGAARFGDLALVGVALLAGFGLASLRGVVRRRVGERPTAVLTTLAVVVATLETIRAPLSFTRPAPVAGIYDRLAEASDAVVAEFPLYEPGRIARNADYMRAATRHWRPMVNGYSGVVPPSYVSLARAVAGFPDPASLDVLVEVGVTTVIVHTDRFAEPGQILADLRRSPRLIPVASDGAAWIFHLRP